MEKTEQPAKVRNRHFSRILNLATAMLPALVAFAAIWGWQAASSTLLGGLLVLLCAHLTRAAIEGVEADDKQRMKRNIWRRLWWRLLLLALTLYAMLQAPWIRLEPLVLGLSLFFPAVVAELIIEIIESRKHTGT